MKKVFALALALALALSMAVMSSAAAADDIKQVISDLMESVGADKLQAAVQEAIDKVSKDLDLPELKKSDVDASKLPAETGNAVADELIKKLGLEDTDIAGKLQDCMSNDFVSFLCGMYTDKKIITTGDSSASVIAIASAAALCAVAAAAFVCLKKKDD